MLRRQAGRPADTSLSHPPPHNFTAAAVASRLRKSGRETRRACQAPRARARARSCGGTGQARRSRGPRASRAGSALAGRTAPCASSPARRARPAGGVSWPRRLPARHTTSADDKRRASTARVRAGPPSPSSEAILFRMASGRGTRHGRPATVRGPGEAIMWFIWLQPGSILLWPFSLAVAFVQQ